MPTAAAFSRAAAALGADGQNRLPMVRGAEADRSLPAKTVKSSVGATQDAKQHATATLVHDAKSDDAGAIQPLNQDQGTVTAGMQNPSPTILSGVNQGMVAHAETATDPTRVSVNAASGSRGPVHSQDSGVSSTELQTHSPVVVNTAQLVQRMGESGIRVGMRCSDFGEVSIRTTVGRNSISAQISLEHSELARAIAAHVPEVQARLGLVQPVDVRISTTHQTAGPMGFVPGGTGQGSGQGHEYTGRNQSNSQRAAPADDNPLVVTTPVPNAVENSLERGRLDIRA